MDTCYSDNFIDPLRLAKDLALLELVLVPFGKQLHHDLAQHQTNVHRQTGHVSTRA